MNEVFFEHVLTFNYGRQALVMIETPKGSKFEDVMRFAVADLRKRYGYEARARLAEGDDRPASWDRNPLVFEDREMWLVVMVWLQWDGRVPFDRKDAVLDE